jgi:hypothetical protein
MKIQGQANPQRQTSSFLELGYGPLIMNVGLLLGVMKMFFN